MSKFKREFKSGNSFMESNARSGNERKPGLRDKVDFLEVQPNQDMYVRFVNTTVSAAIHWIPTDGGKLFPKQCLAWDPKTESFDSTVHCPYCELSKRYGEEMDRMLSEAGRFPGAHKARPRWYANVISRDLQENEPSKKQKWTKTESATGFKEKTSKSWTPVRVISLPAMAINELKTLSGRNKGKDKQFYDVADDKEGVDIIMLYNPDNRTAPYKFERSDKAPLDEEEQNYLIYNLEDGDPVDDLEEAEREVASYISRMFGSDDDEEFEQLANKKHKPADDEEDEEEEKPRKRKKVVEEDEDEDDEDEEPVVRKRRKPVDEDEEEDDEDEEENDDDEDEEEEPPKRRRGRQVEEEDEEEDEDDEEDDEDEEEEEPQPRRRNRKPVEDDDEDDDDDEEEEDEPPVRKRSRKVEEDEDEEETPRRKRGKPVDNDDDDEDEPPVRKRRRQVEEDEDDEDEEEEKPRKRKSRR